MPPIKPGPAFLYHPSKKVVPEVGALRAYSLTSSKGLRLRSEPPGQLGEPLAVSSAIGLLNVEKSSRYLKVGKSTWCNVYAHDVARLSGAYVPRVWWTPDALDAHEQGTSPAPEYAETVRELNANALVGWFAQWSSSYGWKTLFDSKNDAGDTSDAVNRAQDLANGGAVCVIVSKNPTGHGHIALIAPELTGGDALGRRRQTNRGTVPVLSQAGSNNIAQSSTRHAWWRDGHYDRFIFATHP